MLEISFDWETIFSPERVMYLLWHMSVLQEHNLSHHIDVRGFEKTDYSTIWDSAQIKRWSKRQFKFYEQSILVAEGCMVHIIYVIKGLFFFNKMYHTELSCSGLWNKLCKTFRHTCKNKMKRFSGLLYTWMDGCIWFNKWPRSHIQAGVLWVGCMVANLYNCNENALSLFCLTEWYNG